MAFSRDNRLLVTVGPTRGTITIWDVTGSEPHLAAQLTSAHEPEVRAVAISPDGRHLASAGSDGTAKLWDITNPISPTIRPVVVEQNTDDVYDVAFSPDGRTLATANGDTTARLFDVSNPLLPRAGAILDGHLRPVSGVGFSMDGKTLVTTAEDTTARLWNVSDLDHPWLLATPLEGDNETVQSAAFRSDLHTLATAQGQEVRLWETDVDRAITEICSDVPSDISPDQWQHYFPGQEYEPTCPVQAKSRFREPTSKTPAGSTPLITSDSGKCVAIKDVGSRLGAPAYQLGCTGALGENWTLLPDELAVAPESTEGHIVRIVNADSRMCLESADTEQTFKGATLVVQRPCLPGNRDQLWILNVLKRREDSVDVVFLGLKHRDCLNINGESKENGAYVIRWECHTPDHQPNEIFRIHADA